MTDALHRVSYSLQVIRNGIVLCPLAFSGAGGIVCNASAAIKKTINCTAYDIPANVNLLTDRVRVIMHMDGVDSKLGDFIIATAPRSGSSAGVYSYAMEGYDLTYLVYRKKVEKRSDVSFSAGSLYTDIVSQILTACGIIDVIIPESEAALSIDREDWDVGTDYLTIVNTLLSEISYNSLWCDAAGNLRSEPYVSPVLRSPSHDYRSGAKSVVLREHTVEDDTFDSYNIFTVSIDGPDNDMPIYCQSVNDDPASRLSTIQRGRIAAPVTKLSSVSDADAAQAYCDNLKFKSMISTETATIQTAPSADHEVMDIISVVLPELSGKFEEISWELPFDGTSTMKHKMRRAIYV